MGLLDWVDERIYHRHLQFVPGLGPLLKRLICDRRERRLLSEDYDWAGDPKLSTAEVLRRFEALPYAEVVTAPPSSPAPAIPVGANEEGK